MASALLPPEAGKIGHGFPVCSPSAGLLFLREGHLRRSRPRAGRAPLPTPALRWYMCGSSQAPTSARPSITPTISRPCLWRCPAMVRQSSRNCPPTPTMRLTIANDSKVGRRGTRSWLSHSVAGSTELEKPPQILAVRLRARTFPMDYREAGGPQLFELRFEGLPHGRDASVTEPLTFSVTVLVKWPGCP